MGLPVESLRHPSEAAFNAAVDLLKKGAGNYKPPPWIENGTVYWTTRFNPNTGLDEAYFNPTAYDPRKPHLPRGGVYILKSNPEWLLEDPFDLDNLRILDKERGAGFLHSLEELAQNPVNKNKLIAGMFGTGGTIAMHEEIDEEGGKRLVPGIDAKSLLDKVRQGVDENFAVANLDFSTLIDSSQMEIDYMAEIAIATSHVWANASENLKKRFAGFIVAHGTDTMATSSAYLTMMLGPDCPYSVAFVGSQTPSGQDLSEAYTNIKLTFDSLKILHKMGKNEVFIYIWEGMLVVLTLR